MSNEITKREQDVSSKAGGEKEGSVPDSIPLTPTTSLDLSWLPPQQREVLVADYAKGMLDIAKKAQELHVDVAVLRNTLDNLAATTKDVSESGNAVTISHTQTTSVGRTEVMMGNTAKAQSGKFSKSQTGETDWTPYYVIGGIIALTLILIAALS